MRHVSLYRRWRPRTFDAIVGQDAVVRTLRRAIETGRIAHAYLFSGPRGTGKTSTAKVLAMGLNCAKGPTSEPDGTCESCRAIINNSSLDVLEMDAASNRGIDEIRDLRDKVNLAPTQGRIKVYIIDEVHMLTTEAFNALLKMLEEPPEHVVFVLATTEKHKVLPTIISRCQSFDFRRPGVALLSEKLREIAEAEGIEAEPAALTLIAREGKGSFRDAEGVLDQLASFADGPITAARVRELLGSVGSEVLLETTDALYERQTANALRMVDRLQNEGKDLSRFASELVAHLRRLMLLPHAREVALAEVGAEERGALEEQAGRIPTAEVVRMIEGLGDALSRARRGDPKLELELTFLKLARDYTEPQVDALLRRLEVLEKAVVNRVAAAAPREARAGSEVTEELPPAVLEAAKEGEEPAGEALVGEYAGGTGGDVGASGFTLDWGSIVRELEARRPAIAAVYSEAVVEGFDDGVLRLAFPEELAIYVRLAGEPKRMNPLQEILEERLGVRPRLEFRVAGEDGVATRAPTGGVPPTLPQPPWDIPEAISEAEAQRREAAVPGSVSEPKTGSTGGEVGGADDTIRDPQEVFAMARERLGSGGGLGKKQNGGS
ncbi:MAG: DNA polymerase III subunit gamma/tau [Actinomycetota bacterium]|nr:DNA polymerase III subunit gamma/tau [Actinomycetota bacterium]